MKAGRGLLDVISNYIATKITAQSSGYEPYTPSDPEVLQRTLQPGDIILVEGNQKVSSAIKYLTQSTWSHAALYVGDALPVSADTTERCRLVEVNLGEGCVAVPLSKYRSYNTRICRAEGLSADDQRAVVQYMIDRLGLSYDMRNIIDLARYLIPTPPVPIRWRRRMLAFGSGDPTRAICSSLIAQAFQSIAYPILPEIQKLELQLDQRSGRYVRRELLHIRHHSLFVPRDFDLSPYFRVVKPTLEEPFDYKALQWDKSSAAHRAAP